jgi:uncharacterized protein
MTADDLSAPLGQGPPKRRRTFPAVLPKVALGVLAGGLGVFVAVFLAWAIIKDDPFGGEPIVTAPVDLHVALVPKKAETAAAPEAAPIVRSSSPPQRAPDGPTVISVPPAANPANTKTVTIIDGKTGERQEIVIPVVSGAAANNATANGAAANGTATNGTATNGASAGAAAPERQAAEQKFVEMTSHGPVPKIAADGTRPAEAFARPVKTMPGKPDAPRIALIVGGLGISVSATDDAVAKLPGAVTLAFMPYGSDVERQVARARSEGHEILLQAPMEPFGYPDNDSGPQTLLTSLSPEQNLERLNWLMSRFQGYVGIEGSMGARFTASEQSFAPILRETARRGLIFVDDGSNPRSVASRIAGANSLPFAKADIVIDSVPTPAEIEHALGRLEMAAREHGVAVGMASALPVSIEHVAKWAKAAEGRGLLLVPVSAVAAKPKQS